MPCVGCGDSSYPDPRISPPRSTDLPTQVSKGWCITRDELSRCDTWRIGACIFAMFISMGVQMAVETHLAVLATVALYLVLCVAVYMSSPSIHICICICICAWPAGQATAAREADCPRGWPGLGVA